MNQKRIPRRKTLVHAGFQFRVVLIFFLFTLAMQCFSFLITIFMVLQAVERRDMGEAPNINTLILSNMLISLVVILVFSYLFGLFGSHKIAGPLFKMGRMLKNVGSGDLTQEAYLRQGDWLIDFCNDMNESVGSLREIAAANVERIRDVEIFLGQEMEKASGENTTRYEVMLNKLAEARESFIIERPEEPVEISAMPPENAGTSGGGESASGTSES
ncbi:MAG: hypothetical protein ACYS8W_20285 [Planctomycetota bacterium]|jgi:methyl-accepting chemotaxis protein